MTSTAHGMPGLSLLVKAWVEPRELEGLDVLLRGSLEVLGTGERPRHWGSAAELHETIDAVLAAGFPSARL